MGSTLLDWDMKELKKTDHLPALTKVVGIENSTGKKRGGTGNGIALEKNEAAETKAFL